MKQTAKIMVATVIVMLVALLEPLHRRLFEYMSRVGLVLAVTEAIKSTPITNADASPVVLNKAQIDGARLRHKRGVATVTTTKDIGSTYRMFRVKSSEMLLQLLLDNATCGAGCTGDIGLYRTAADGGAVVSAALFASAVDLNTANRALDVTRESGTITVANMEKRLWELLALTADPQIEYDVVITLTAASAATGAVALSASVIGDN